MTDKEILAELKKCWEYLYDIRENSEDEQVDRADKKNIDKMENIIDDIYNNLFQKTHEDIHIKGEKNLIIADNVYVDYYDIEEDEFVAKDMIIKDGKEYEWWNDTDFILN